MQMGELIVLLVVVLVAMQFWRIRGIAEQAKTYIQQYCEKYGLQLISLARQKTRLGIVKGKPDWHCQFSFEFSGTGEDSYQGSLRMAGTQILEVDMPAYRINSSSNHSPKSDLSQ